MNLKALTAEFIGTFTLCFIGIGAIANNAGLVGVALAHGLAIAVMVAALAGVSGAHFNPAVTAGLFVTKKINASGAIGYIIAQCLGAIVAAGTIKICFPAAALAAVGMGTPALGAGISPMMGLITEIVLTFFLVFVIYGVAVDKRGMQPAALFIGLTVTLDILCGGPISGAAMNPARHLGPALLGGGLDNLWIYWVGPMIGGVVAAVLYKNVLEK